MADAMSNHEIEDVLASIRRLVSDDLRPAPARPAPAPLRPVAQALYPDDSAEPRYRPQAAEPVPPVLDPVHSDAKLLLTPSLRVAEVQHSTAVFDDRRVGDAQGWSGLSQTTAQDYAQPDDAAAWLSGADLPPADTAPSDPAFSYAPEGAAQQNDQHAFDASPRSDDGEPVEDTQAYEVEPDFKAEAEPAQASVAPDPAADWAEHAEADIRARLEEEVVHRYHQHDMGHDAAQAADGMSDAQEYTFDEQVLRDLVRDIIREELAGNLGERLTRNVRKLVRAEIARALAVQEFG